MVSARDTYAKLFMSVGISGVSKSGVLMHSLFTGLHPGESQGTSWPGHAIARRPGKPAK